MKINHCVVKWIASSVLVLVAALALPGVYAQDTQVVPVVDAVTRPGPDAAKDSASRLASAGVEHAMAGKFDLSYKELSESAKAQPDNASIAAAVRLLDGFKSVSEQSDRQRKQELDNAVEDVQLSMFALKAQAQMGADGLSKKLRLKVIGGTPASQPATATSEPASQPEKKTVVSAYNKTSTSEVLANIIDPEAARKTQASTVKALQEARATLQEAVAIAKGDSGEYAGKFGQCAAKLDKQFELYLQAWQDAKLDNAQGISAAVAGLRKIEDDLVDALAQVEALVAEKPYLMALAQARVAVSLLSRAEREKVAEIDWYRQLVDEVLKLGAKAMEKQEWYEALSVYSNLQELAPDVEEYRDKSKTAQRHVRVMRLYGARTAPAPTSGAAEEDPTWKEIVSGVDVEMVRAAISQLDENYVTAPDYRKLARSGLSAVKVLAQTPQASNAFASLSDAAKRDKFVKAIDDLIAGVETKKRMDQMDLQFTLNDLIQASELTVSIPKNVLSVEFTDGCLEELDKFSNMIWPYDVADFTKSTMGNFFGVGIQIGKEPGEPLKVVSPLEDSPAYRAGIKSGDLVLEVDGQKTEPLNTDALIKRITGPENTKVTLLIKRAGTPPYTVELIRQQIKIKTVKGWQRKGDDWDYMIDHDAKIGYIRMTQFTDQTAKELVAKIEELKKAGMKSLILDLRFNPGGLLRSAGAVSDEFLKEGKIVSTRGRQSGESQIDATPSGSFQEGDMVVLVNQYSASAAEIVSGALKDLHRAVVVGQRSYGKGSVQNVVYVARRKAILKVTNAYYYLPSGRCLHRKNGDKEWGVDPDVDVMLSPRQMKHWLDIRRKTDLLQDVDAAQLKAEMTEQFNADVQLSTAVMLLKLKQLHEANKAVPDVAEAK